MSSKKSNPKTKKTLAEKINLAASIFKLIKTVIELIEAML